MNQESSENKMPNFEAIIAQEVGDMDLEVGAIAAEKVSEVVGETPSDSGGKSDSSTKKASTRLAFGSVKTSGFWSRPHKDQPLPTTFKQKKALKKVLTKRTRKLVRKAAHIERSKHFSAHQLEEVMQEIRHLQKIIKELAQATLEKIETLYRRYVLKG